MPLDPGRFRVQKLIVHEVPRRVTAGNGPPVVLSEVESEVNADIRNFFQEKISTSLDTAALEVLFDPATTSPVPALVREILAGDRSGTFVQRSQEMARHLHNCQTPVSPSGLLTVIDGTLAQQPSLAILKLEKEEGVRVRLAHREGRSTFNVEHIRDLMLTGKTKVFKVGLFARQGETERSDQGLVSDKQRGYYAATGVADFFLKQFLGCMLRERPAVTTKTFFEASERFINEEVADPVTKTQYQTALVSELNSQRGMIRPVSFARDHFAVEHRQPYIDYLAAAHIPAHEITKDNSLIAPQLRKVQMKFESGIAVLAPQEAFEQHVKVQSIAGGQTSVEIRDHLTNIKGRG